jgi:hypothetical protein
MKKILSLLLICAGSIHLFAQDPSVPAEVRSFIGPGYTLMDIARQDLNGDRLQDYVIILKTSAEDSLEMGAEAPARPLIVLLRQPDKKLKPVVTNNEIVLCKFCGGVFGDPYQGIMTKPGEFTLSFYGGSSWRWSEDYTFRYDRIKKNWFLETHRSSSFHSGDPDKTMVTATIRRKEIGDIDLAHANPDYNTDNNTWKVQANKTFFYNSPDLLAKPGKAYLVKGDEIVASKRFTNFIYASFTNGKGEVSSGYILKKDVIKK